MATQEGGSPIGGTIGKSPIERDMNMAEAGEASGMTGDVSGETTRVTFTAANEQWDRNKNGKRLRSDILESSSAPGDWRSRMERTMRQQACEVAQLHQTVVKMARMLEAHAVWRENPFLTATATQFGRGKPAGGVRKYRDNEDGLSDGGGRTEIQR
jgi:hypothetical protein